MKYEANLSKTDESLYLHTKYNCFATMNRISKIYGPFSDREIDFYIHEMKNQNGEAMNAFQRNLIFNLFYKFFSDTQSIQGINIRDYIKLMLSAKKMLQANRMVYMPYIISSKIDKIVTRKTLNKREMTKMEVSPYYKLVQEKYKNDKIVKQILSTIATLITSSFRIIEYDDYNPNPSTGCNGDVILHAGKNNGMPLSIEADMIIEECLLYILLI